MAQSIGTLVRLADTTKLRRGVHPSVQALKAGIRHYISVTNEHPTPFRWTKTADEIRASVARFRQRTSETGH
jgi:hypothetical protein